MNIWKRLAAAFEAKVHAAVDRIEDPLETLEAAYVRQHRVLHQVRRSVADVLTSEKRLEIELERGDPSSAQHDRLLAEIAAVRAQRRSLEEAAVRLRHRVDAMRGQKLALAARYSAAKAVARAGEAIAGLANDGDEVDRMVERAHDASLLAEARARAIGQLVADVDDPARVRATQTALVDQTPDV